MTVDTMMTRPATIIRRTEGPPDEYGNPTEVEDGGTPVLCQVARPTVRELTELTDTAIDEWLCFLPVDTEVGFGDAIDVDGLGLMEVVGRPDQVWHPPTASYHHIELRLRAVT